MDNLLGTVEPGKQANLTVVDGKGYFDADAKVRSVWIEGRLLPQPGRRREGERRRYPQIRRPSGSRRCDENQKPRGRRAESTSKTETNKEPKEVVQEDTSKTDKKQAEKDKKLAKIKELQKRVARSPLDGRGVLTNPPAVLIQNATIWTCGPEGILTNADLLDRARQNQSCWRTPQR